MDIDRGHVRAQGTKRAAGVRSLAGRRRDSLSRRVAFDVALLALIAVGVAAIAGAFGPARPFLVFMAACLVPGGALLTRLRVQEPAAALAIAVTFSLCVEILGSLALLWTGFWHPALLATAIGAGSAGLIGWDLAPASWRRLPA